MNAGEVALDDEHVARFQSCVIAVVDARDDARDSLDRVRPDAEALELGSRDRAFDEVTQHELRRRHCAADRPAARAAAGRRRSRAATADRPAPSVRVRRLGPRAMPPRSARRSVPSSIATTSGTIASSTWSVCSMRPLDASRAPVERYARRNRPMRARADDYAVVVADWEHGAGVSQADIEPLGIGNGHGFLDAVRRVDRPRGLGLGRGDALDDLGRQFAQAGPVDVVPADDALAEIGRREARACARALPLTTRSRAAATSMPRSRHVARNRPIGNMSVPCSSKCWRYPSAASCSTVSRWRASSWSSSVSGSIAVTARLAWTACGRSSDHHCAARARHGRASSVRVALRSHRRIAGRTRGEHPEQRRRYRA